MLTSLEGMEKNGLWNKEKSSSYQQWQNLCKNVPSRLDWLRRTHELAGPLTGLLLYVCVSVPLQYLNKHSTMMQYRTRIPNTVNACRLATNRPVFQLAVQLYDLLCGIVTSCAADKRHVVPTGSSSTKQTTQEWCRSAGRRPTRTGCTWCRNGRCSRTSLVVPT
jgi:hypothetical protein